MGNNTFCTINSQCIQCATSSCRRTQANGWIWFWLDICSLLIRNNAFELAPLGKPHCITVPRRTNLPEALVMGRAVLAVRGVLMACSMVPGLPDWVLGLTNPVMGRPDCVMGLQVE